MTERENELIDRLTDTLERMHLDDYLEYVSNRRRMLWNNLMYGAVRGLGFTLGFTVLGRAGHRDSPAPGGGESVRHRQLSGGGHS